MLSPLIHVSATVLPRASCSWLGTLLKVVQHSEPFMATHGPRGIPCCLVRPRLNPALLYLSNCDSDRCSLTGGLLHRQLINTSHPHFSAHPDVFLTVLCQVRSPSMLNSTATFQPPALSGLCPAIEATLPSLGLTGIWIISSLWAGPGSNKHCFC